MDGPLVQCQICQESYTQDQFRFYKCGHGFCKKCINITHLRAKVPPRLKLHCAICRSSIDEEPRQIFMTYTPNATADPHRASQRGAAGGSTSRSPSGAHDRLLAHFAQQISENADLREEIDRSKQQLQEAEKTRLRAVKLKKQLQETQETCITAIAMAESAKERLGRETKENARLAQMIQRQKRAIDKKDEELRLLNAEVEDKDKQTRVLKIKLGVLTKRVKLPKSKHDFDDSLQIV